MFTMVVVAWLALELLFGSLVMQVPRLSGAALWFLWLSTWVFTSTLDGAGLCLASQVGVGWSTWLLTSVVAGLGLALQVHRRMVGLYQGTLLCLLVVGLWLAT